MHILEIGGTALRQSIRSLLRNPGYSIPVVALMTLTIGANVASFSALWSVVLKALPYPDADRLVAPQVLDTKRNTVTGISMPNFLDLARLTRSFEYLGSYYT